MNPLKRILTRRESENLAQRQIDVGIDTRFPTTANLGDYPKTSPDDPGVQIMYEGGVDPQRDALLTAIASCNSAYSGYMPVNGLRFRWWHCKDKNAAKMLWESFKSAGVNTLMCTRSEHHDNVRRAVRDVFGPDAMASQTCGKCGKNAGPEDMAKPGVCTGCYEGKTMIVVPAGVI